MATTGSTPPPAPPAADEAAPKHDSAAQEFGQRAARVAEWLPLSWDEVAPELARGWESRHQEVCGCIEDWRLSFPFVEAGWRATRQAH